MNEIKVLRNQHKPIRDENGRRIPIPDALFQHVEAFHEEVGKFEYDPLGLVLSQLVLKTIAVVLVFLGALTLSCAGFEVGELLSCLVGGGT